MGTAWWRFLPDDARAPGADDLLRAAKIGKGSLSRTLRDARARLGSAQTAALLKAVEAGEPFGVPLSLLLVTAQQPRSLRDALTVGFAIAGLAVDIRCIEGIGELHRLLGEPLSSSLAGADLSLLFLGERQSADERGESELVESLARSLAQRSLAPVAVLRFGNRTEPHPDEEAASGVSFLDIPPPDTAIFDDRFTATFGTILTSDAADRLSDAGGAFAARLKGLGPKLLVTDLDGTLWDGVIGEGTRGGPARPAIRDAYARVLLRLRERGLVLAIASRNDPADVERLFREETLWPIGSGDFSARAIGWEDKASLVATALAQLGLAPEHAVFIDDDPVNCARVAARFPAMDVRRFGGGAATFAADLLADPMLAGSGPGRDSRAEQYDRRAAVKRLRADKPDITAFLEALGTQVTIRPLGVDLYPRAAELASRVNQFLFTEFRPNALQLGARTDGLDFIARLDDAFGGHGLVGLVLASRHDDDAVIDNFYLSCRALDRGVEGAMLHAIVQTAQRQGLGRIVGRIHRLARNEPARDCLRRYGFTERDGEWIYDLSDPGGLEKPPENVAVRFETAEGGGR